MYRLLQSIPFMLVFFYSSFAFAERYSCGNGAMEVQCDADKCESSESHTPMAGGVDTSTRKISICAYSACWSGKAEILLNDEDFVVAYGKDLRPNNATAGRATIVFVIDPENLGATFNGFGFQNPMSCSVDK